MPPSSWPSPEPRSSRSSRRAPGTTFAPSSPGPLDRRSLEQRVLLQRVQPFQDVAHARPRPGRGPELFLRLVADADVVIENYRADVLDKPSALATTCSGPGQGGHHPRLDGRVREDRILTSHVGFGPIIEMMSGLMSLTGYGRGRRSLQDRHLLRRSGRRSACCAGGCAVAAATGSRRRRPPHRSGPARDRSVSGRPGVRRGLGRGA